MDNELLYGDPEGDPITNTNARIKINSSEEVAVDEIYSNATSITSEPIIPGGDVNFESTLPPVADINGAAASSSSAGFSQQTLDIVKSDNTAGQKIFLTKSV